MAPLLNEGFPLILRVGGGGDHSLRFESDKQNKYTTFLNM
jgi:hypothetical protein